MTTKSSIHFAKCRPAGQPERHNFRQYSSDDFRPSYFLPPEDQLPNTYKDLLEPENTDAAEAADHAKAYFDQVKAHYSGRGKRAKYDNCRREAILNLSESSTEDDVRGVVKYLEDKWHIKTTSYAIHRDEGYKDQDGTIHRNLHAHLVLDSLYLDKNGKPKQAWSAITINDLRTIQDDIAKIMGMERTKGNGRKHLDRETYATVKAAQDRAAQATKQAERATAKAEVLTAQATAAAKQAAQETEQARQAKATAAKQAQETARQRQQIQHDIEVHKLQPSGILVNRALREANTQQAAIIDKLRQQAKDAEFRHSREIGKKDSEIQEAAHTYNDQRQTIRQLRQQIAEQAKTINEQAETISAYEGLANMMRDVIEVIAAAVPEKIIDTAIGAMTKAVEKAGRLGHKILDLWEKTANHKEREAAERLEREQAARAEREAAERRQAEEAARKSRGRGYSR